MGVPSYFGWIMKQSKKFGLYNMIHCRLSHSVKRLYLDFNCLIHRACREAKNAKTEDDLINHVIFVLAQIVNFVQPSDLVYIAVDGSVPMGKCKQQRFRRFKSVKEATDIQEIYTKYHQTKEDTYSFFDFNSISPGTNFMDNLACQIKQKFEEWNLTNPKLNYILSDSHLPGEGEHKIVHHFKEYPLAKDQTIVVYGLDADLIFLSLSLHHHNTFLFRENVFNETIENCVPDYMFLNIGELYDNLVQLIIQADDIVNLPIEIGKYYINEITDYHPVNLINDYIFFNYFLGNDFVNRIYSFSIKNRGCETILQIYRYCLRKSSGYLINSKGQVNLDFLQNMLQYMKEYEDYWWLNPPKYIQPRLTPGQSKLEQEIEEYGIVERYLQEIDLNRHDQYFKENYYCRLFHLNGKLSLDDNIRHICQQYWLTIQWTIQYYLDKCPDWDWYYPYEYAPLVEDLVKYADIVNDSSYFSPDSQPISVFHQLMIILPPKSFHLLPKRFHQILNNPKFKQFYPTNFSFHFYGHRYLWECPPKIPVLDSRITKSYYDYLERNS